MRGSEVFQFTHLRPFSLNTMIVKILSSASNFAGIHYNERKNDAGKSELLCAENFGSLALHSNPGRADYVNYLKSFCNRNTRVKKVQFHAVISAKGKDYSLDKLRNIGLQFLRAMGYGNNPYLIYHHSDTNHRHIHLISTRVDRDGKRVDDRFEKLRSQKVMHKILMRDPNREADQCLDQAMHYQFSTLAQFTLLLELRGFKVVEASGKTSMVKYGTVLRGLDSGVIEQRMNACAFPKGRATQLKAIFKKYAVGHINDQWAEYMNRKFGLDIVFHRKQGYERPYGYTVVDHASKSVFKGAQILSLAELLATPRDKSIVELVHELAAQPDISFHEFQRELAGLGISITHGPGYSWSSGQGSLSAGALKKLRYAERLHVAAKFQMNDASCTSLLGKLLSVRSEEIASFPLPNNKFEAHKAVLAYLEQSKRWDEGLNHFNCKLMNDDTGTFLFVANEPALIHVEQLLGRSLSIAPDLIPHVSSIMDLSGREEFHASKENILTALVGIVAAASHGPKEDKNTKKKTIKL